MESKCAKKKKENAFLEFDASLFNHGIGFEITLTENPRIYLKFPKISAIGKHNSHGRRYGFPKIDTKMVWTSPNPEENAVLYKKDRLDTYTRNTPFPIGPIGSVVPGIKSSLFRASDKPPDLQKTTAQIPLPNWRFPPKITVHSWSRTLFSNGSQSVNGDLLYSIPTSVSR